MIHKTLINSEEFNTIDSGLQNAIIIPRTAHFQIHETIILLEYDIHIGKQTDRSMSKTITHVKRAGSITSGLNKDYVMLSIMD